MTTYYKATFSNGQVLTRSTAGRTYSHAYLTGHSSGWARNELLAHKAMAQWRSYKAVGGEVAPAVEITPFEYRDLKKSAHAKAEADTFADTSWRSQK